MKLTWNELTVDPTTHTPEDLLSEWRWLLDDTYQIILISSLGDLFLADATQRVHWLDVGIGRLTQVANTFDEFQQIRQEPANAAEWFASKLIGDIMQGGGRLVKGQCFSYKLAPILGGQYEPANFEPTDLSVHFSIFGQIQRQTKYLPDGTVVSGFHTVPP